MKCPSANGILYPAHSGNTCSGHGTCDPETGQCTCAWGYQQGDLNACEGGTCPEDCRGRGDCDHRTGTCSCHDGSYGEFCQFSFCPMQIETDCSGGGKCNRNDGQCICNKGH